MRRLLRARSVLSGVGLCATLLLGGAGSTVFGLCGPFTDVSDAAFCPFVLEIFYLGITTGTTATTYDPTGNVTRLQMAAFLSRTVDRTLQRSSRRAALDQFWTSQNGTVLGLTTVGTLPVGVRSDGADLWVANLGDYTVSRVRGSDGKLLETWIGATKPFGVLVAMGRVFVTGQSSPGNLYQIDPSQPAGSVTTLASNLGNLPYGIAFDGARIWTANNSASVSIVTPGPTIPWTVTTVTVGPTLVGALYDGSNIWVASGESQNVLLKLDAAGTVLQTVTLGAGSFAFPAFDGSNIWVPNTVDGSVSVVRSATGAVLQTLTGNGLDYPVAAAFDGQRVLVTTYLFYGQVSLFKAADLSPLGFFPTGTSTNPFGVCSDGVNFWITLGSASKLARF